MIYNGLLQGSRTNNNVGISKTMVHPPEQKMMRFPLSVATWGKSGIQPFLTILQHVQSLILFEKTKEQTQR